MRKRTSTCICLLAALLAAFLVIAATRAPAIREAAPAEKERPGLITIDIPSIPGQDEMPSVPFLHGKHAEALDKDCAACHREKDGKPVFLFQRLEEQPPEAAMTLYHDNCVSCHVDKKEAGLASGPNYGECRRCHDTRSDLTARQRPVPFDRSLHYRHEQAEAIPAETIAGESRNCGACHHRLNPETDKLYYEKGQEGACVYCHQREKTEEASSLRTASHEACVACHQSLRSQKTAAGPVTCVACHGPEAFQEVETLAEVPRIERDQPDTVFLTGLTKGDKWPTDKTEIEKSLMNPVPFDHKSHEKATGSCLTCHHASLETCTQCHTDRGDEKGDYVRLDQAMHAAGSDRSCLGCHLTETSQSSCAGCHYLMADNDLTDQTCQKCHLPDITVEQLLPLAPADRQAMAETALNRLRQTFSPVESSKIPEKVTIDVIAKEYEPSQMPHRKMVSALTEKIQSNELAAVFHGDGRTLCGGCHHHSPLSYQPPACASCHGRSTFAQDGRPGLKGAYHGQCITCHQQMDVKAVAATDCVKCHQEKKEPQE